MPERWYNVGVYRHFVPILDVFCKGENLMKRIFACTLILLLLLVGLCSCGFDATYTGPVYYMYLNDIPTTLDPMYAYTDDAAMAIMPMLYEGLFKIDENGKVSKALCESYKKVKWDTNTGIFEVDFALKDSRWSDQRTVQATDFVYAWRRLIDPSSDSDAAVLLYDIKNAKDIKNAVGTKTKNDFGVSASTISTVHVELVGQQKSDGSYAEPDLDAFIEKLASPMLVPVREDAVDKLKGENWATNTGTIPSNGPFYLKSYNITASAKDLRSSELRLQRNAYYLREFDDHDEAQDAVNEYVEPYGIVIRYTVDQDRDENGTALPDSVPYYSSSAAQALAYFKSGNLDYLSYLALEDRAAYKDQVTLSDTAYTHTYRFNTLNPLFEKAEVRRALSLAIDRTALAEMLVFAKPATSIVIPLAYETGSYSKNAEHFTDHLTNSVSATAKEAEAKELLQKAGVTSGAFTITVRSGDEVALATANYCAEVWGRLGFTVTVRKLGVTSYIYNDYDAVYDQYLACLRAGGADYNTNPPGNEEQLAAGYDVIAVETFMNSTDPFTVLAPFAKTYTGGFLDLSVSAKEYEAVLPAGGYDSETYKELIDKAYAAVDKAERSAFLHEADKLLMEDMPIMPLFTTQTAVLKNSKMKNVSYRLGGVPDFSRMSIKGIDPERDEEKMKEEAKQYSTSAN